MKRLLSTIVLVISVFSLALPVLAQDEASPETTPEVTPEATSEADADPTCFVTTDLARTVRVRVGPGENRTSVTFLPEDVEIPVLGKTEDDAGNLWYRVDKELAAPGRAINEAWVAADNDELETIGDCDDIADASAPPIIPIISQPSPSPVDDETAEGDETILVDNATPSDGIWTISWSGTTNVSCVDTGNVAVATSEIFGQPGAGLLPVTTSVLNITRPNAEAPFLFMFTPMYALGNGSYRGEITFFDSDGTLLPATIVINSASANQMSGYMTITAGDCSGTVSFVATR